MSFLRLLGADRRATHNAAWFLICNLIRGFVGEQKSLKKPM